MKHLATVPTMRVAMHAAPIVQALRAALVGVGAVFGVSGAVAHSELPGGPPPPAGEALGFVDDLETLATLPTALHGQTSFPTVHYGFVPPPANLWRGAVLPAASLGIVDLSSSPVGGGDVLNNTRALRALAAPGGSPGPFGGVEFRRCEEPMTPSAEGPVRFSADIYNTSAMIAGAIDMWGCQINGAYAVPFWGGTNSDPAGPQGPIEHYWMFYEGETGAQYTQSFFVDTAPAGFNVGDPVPVVVGRWHRLIIEMQSYSVVNVYLDYLDGQGEFRILTAQTAGSPLFNTSVFRFGYGGDGDGIYIDNVSHEGFRFVPPEPPPLSCHYIETFDAYPIGFTLASMGVDRWTAPNLLYAYAAARILEAPAGPEDRSLYKATQTGSAVWVHAASDLPPVEALEHGPWRFCADVQTSVPAAGASTYTQHSIRLTSSDLAGVVPMETAVRVFLGALPAGSGYIPKVYVQINPEFTFSLTSTNWGFPVVGSDVADTGIDWTHGPTHEVCVSVAADQTMRIEIDGALIYEGEAFASSVDGVAFEAARRGGGANAPRDEIRIDNVRLFCPCPGDTTLDGLVDFADLNEVVGSINQSGAGLAGDVNGDGVVDFQDLNIVLSHYLVACW